MARVSAVPLHVVEEETFFADVWLGLSNKEYV
jgi:hypothetical protein